MQEIKTTLQKMNLIDQFLFNEVMEYQDAFESVVSILLGEKIKLLSKPEIEKGFSQEFLDFMGYIVDSTDQYAQKVDSVRIKLIHKRVTQIKRSERTGVKLMQSWEELAMEREEAQEQGLEEGREQGSKQRLVNQICRKLRKGKVPEEIAEALEEKLDVIQSICQAAAAFAPDFDEEKVYHAWREKSEDLVFS